MADIPSIPAWNPGAKEGLGRQRMPLLCRWAKFPNQTMNDEDLIYWYIYIIMYIYIYIILYIYTPLEMNTVYMVFVGLGDILDPMFLLITVACLWIKKMKSQEKLPVGAYG
jgi:hypothetical protein